MTKREREIENKRIFGVLFFDFVSISVGGLRSSQCAFENALRRGRLTIRVNYSANKI